MIEVVLPFLMWESKTADFNASGLFRAAHLHNPAPIFAYRGVKPHFYAHIGAGSKVFRPLMSKLMWA